MARRSLIGVGVLVLAAACSAPGPHRPALSEAELLSGDALAVSPDMPIPISADQAVTLDDEMRAFVGAEVRGVRDPRAKLHRLIAGMRSTGLLGLDYDASFTRTAQQTFHEREGNCLSFTMLFVALARQAGLNVSYQIVDVPPNWSNEADVIVVRHHINAVVETPVRDFIVDFNLEAADDRYERWIVSDDYTLALFYNNLGAEALIRKDYALGFRYLREAALVHPDIASTWVNLGALYSRQKLPQQAQAAYLHALAINPAERSALSNLANLYAATGQEESAEIYRQRIRRYQLSNPYYHYSLAQQAYGEGRYADAEDELRRALRLKREEPQFYVLLGRVYLDTGRDSIATASFARGRDHATPGEGRASYDAQVQALTGDGAPP